MISRRTFLTAAAALAATPRVAWAQEKRRIAMVEVVEPITVIGKSGHPLWGALFEGLEELGWIEGQNLVIERYSGGGKDDLFPALAEAVVNTKPDVIYSMAQRLLLTAFEDATTTIPIVSVAPHEAFRLVESLARPGRNFTGPTNSASVDGTGLNAKRLQLLGEVVPTATRVAILARRTQWTGGPGVVATREFAPRLGFTLVPALTDPPVSETTYSRIFEALAREDVDAMLVHGGRENQTFRATIVQLVGEAQLPAIYGSLLDVEIGGLMAYGVNRPASYRRAAYYIDRILNGDDPAVLPIEQPTLFDFVINLRTARELGIEFPLKILMGATEVTE